MLIFDGMRFDSWETVVKPLLAEFFTIQDAPYFCVLPSFTVYARIALLAGALPTEWKGFKGTYSDNEQQLFAVNMGLTAQEAKTKLRFVTEADTTKARAKLDAAGYVTPERYPNPITKCQKCQICAFLLTFKWLVPVAGLEPARLFTVPGF